jgi:serine phosphatase RsbU (regulator of sigma subunit)
VSGKGIPAALLMAVTKEVVRDVVLTFEPALDRILAEANRKLAAASTELQSWGGIFVTAFAGILDLGSGEVDYASAGRDSPFIFGGGTGLRQLVTDAGPPLWRGRGVPLSDRPRPGQTANTRSILQRDWRRL